MEYDVRATYLVTRKLVVRVPPGADPLDPNTWIEIQEEHDTDNTLYEVLDAQQVLELNLNP